MTALLRRLRQMGACADGIALVRRYSTPARWWAASRRGDHMLWLAGRASVRRQDLVLAACDCARLALRYVLAGEERPRIAIETAERWARGRATLDEVRNTYDAAYSAAYSAAARVVADDDAYAADDAAFAAAADAAAADAAAADAYDDTLARCAALVRKRIPWSAVRAALAGKGER